MHEHVRIGSIQMNYILQQSKLNPRETSLLSYIFNLGKYGIYSYTWTTNPCVLRMIAVMYLKSIVGTVKETRFISTATDIVECDVSRALSIAAPRGSALSIPVPHAPTKNLCVIHVPFIITNGSPGSVAKHLHTTLSVGSPTDKLCIWKWIKKQQVVSYYREIDHARLKLKKDKL